jgi:hypothetical protein
LQQIFDDFVRSFESWGTTRDFSIVVCRLLSFKYSGNLLSDFFARTTPSN